MKNRKMYNLIYRARRMPRGRARIHTRRRVVEFGDAGVLSLRTVMRLNGEFGFANQSVIDFLEPRKTPQGAPWGAGGGGSTNGGGGRVSPVSPGV